MKHHTIRNKPRKNCGPKLTNRVRELTRQLHNESIELARNEIPIEEEVGVSDLAHENYLKNLKLKAHELYQQRIRTLSTKDLEDILWVHECGSYKRMPETLENITSELAKRQFFE